jgi:hypothetical protein
MKKAATVGQKPAGRGELARLEGGRDIMARRQGDKLTACVGE